MKQHISHWGLTITASVRELWRAIGAPEQMSNDGDPTYSNFVWHGMVQTEDDEFLLYDVYDYLSKEKFLKDEQIEWRINAEGSFASLRVKDFLIERLNKVRNEKETN